MPTFKSTHYRYLFFALLTLQLLFQSQLSHSTEQKKAVLTTTNKTPSTKAQFNVLSEVMRNLMLRLYECDPNALQKSTQVSKEEFIDWVFFGPFGWKFDAIRNRQSLSALQLSADADYHGDYVLPLITGLHTHLLKSYGGETEFYFPNSAVSDALYKAAHNIKVSQFKLSNTKMQFEETCKTKVNAIFNALSQQVMQDADTINNAGKILNTTELEGALSKENNQNEFISE